MISKKNFKRKAGSYPFSKACWLFSYTTYFPFSLFFLSLFKVIIICLFPFFFASLWKGRADEGAHYLLMSNHKVNEKKHVMVSPNSSLTLPSKENKKEKIPDQKNRQKAKRENSQSRKMGERKKERKFPIKDRKKTEEICRKVLGPDNIWTIQNCHQVNKKRKETTT